MNIFKRSGKDSGNRILELSVSGSPKREPVGISNFVIITLILILIVVFSVDIFIKLGLDEKVGLPLATTEYQAVFLTGGQHFFGKLEAGKGGWLILRDVYYLQVSKAGGLSDITSLNPDLLQSNFQLIKLGSEIHKPQDKIFINGENILYWENIDDGSKVVEAIKKYKK